MNPGPLPESPWQYAYDNQTKMWLDQCAKRWERAEELLLAGYQLILLMPLSKRALPRADNLGLHNPIRTAKTLRMHTAPGAKYHDCNYGIITGIETCIVLDLDTKTDRPGPEALIELEATHAFYVPRESVVTTPTGGQHIYLAWDENVGSRVRAFGESIGIDVLSSDGKKAKRHVVGPESVTELGVYVETKKILAVTLLEEHKIPPELKKLLPTNNVVDISTRPGFAGKGRGNEQVNEEDIFGKMTLAALMEVMEHIKAEDLSFDEWLRVGMALHHERGDDGYQIWLEWSADDKDRFDIKACQQHWDTFDESSTIAPVTMGTVINLARRNGYIAKPNQRALSLMEQIQAETPNAYLGGQCRFVRVTADGEVQEMSREDARSWYEGQEVVVNGKMKNPIDLFMKWTGRIRHDRYELLPPPIVCPPTTVNVWRGYAVHPVKGDVRRYLDLFNQMITDKIEREWVHDWFADLVQNTGKKPDTALVFKGPEGTGKNTLINVFRAMFLDNNTTHFVSTDQFTSKFNKHMARSVLAIVNEAVWSGNHAHASMLKGYISEDKFEVQDKNVKGFQARNCTRIVVMSNEDWAVPAGADSRRFCVCQVPRVREPSDPWWKETKKMLKDKAMVAAVMHWYQNRTITNNLHKVPQNEALTMQRIHTKARSRQGDKQFVSVILRLLANGKALTKQTDKGTKYLISTEMVKRAFFYAHDTRCDDQFIWSLRHWLRENLGIAIETGIKVKYKQVQRQASAWPPPHILAHALAKFEMVDKEDIDCAGEWTEDDMEW